jgi:hypothetical protein
MWAGKQHAGLPEWNWSRDVSELIKETKWWVDVLKNWEILARP